MFSSVLQTMITAIQTGLQAIGKKITDYSSSSVIGVILAAIASAIDELNTAISTARQQAYLKTATSNDLDNKAADYGITRKQPTYAQWTFVAVKNSVSSQQIPIAQGSLITTIPAPGVDPITFTVNQTVNLPIGTSTVNIPVTCQQAGSVGNISTGTQLLWGSSVPGIDGVQFNDASTGTKGIDRELDEPFRARALSAFQGLSISTLAWYQSTAQSITGIQSAKVVPLGRGAGTVDIYVVGQNNTIPVNDLISTVQSTIDNGRVITDDAKVFAPTAVIVNVNMTIKVLSGNDPIATAALVQTAIQNFINDIGIGGGTTGVLYLSQLQAVALGVKGVANAPVPSLPTADVTFTSYQLPQAGSISITAS